MLALGFTPGIGVISAKKLIEQFGSATEVFAHRTELPRLAAGFPDHLAEALGDPAVSERAKREWDFASRHDIRCLCLNDEAYPSRMRECTDAPLVLFYKGSADLNALHMVAIVGTRHITDYGRMLCTHFVKELKDCCPDAVIVSGLAYGVDICAHRAALDCGTDTVGVLAHGWTASIPPSIAPKHRACSRRAVCSRNIPAGRFPTGRTSSGANRIIAGLCDATVVIESATKGGSLITAELASEYGRECFAFPGPVGAPLFRRLQLPDTRQQSHPAPTRRRTGESPPMGRSGKAETARAAHFLPGPHRGGTDCGRPPGQVAHGHPHQHADRTGQHPRAQTERPALHA